ncbi:hypothetical protein WJU23_06715 [Prosthecobacter sp. SYSU 5D2]|uniref:hypothetical protein n=1 Tax=Prosthecobacter sp. SYSU 5D2 TaxID=3134134 RepID=UPI0031FE5538
MRQTVVSAATYSFADRSLGKLIMHLQSLTNHLRLWVLLPVLLLLGELAGRAEMMLLHREMFTSAEALTPESPGENFTSVAGNLLSRPGGPHLAGSPGSSAELRGQGAPAVGWYNFASSDRRKIFVGAWFMLKDLQGGYVDLLGLCDIYGNTSPYISIQDGKLGGGIMFNSFTPAGVSWNNQWIYLGIAIHLKSGTTADVRFYYKHVGQPMQSWAPIDNGHAGIASLGYTFAGSWSYGTFLKGRVGAPSAYAFEENDFSDVAYPADLIEPESRLTWYCDPLSGDDEADGTSPQTAWKSAAKVNEESLYTGMLPASSYEEGDTLIINTAGQELDLDGIALKFSTPGLNVRAAEGQEWIRIKSHRDLPATSWVVTATTNVFATSDTQDHIVLWEDDKFMHHPTGDSFASVQEALTSTPGSFWTDGITLYVHPFGSTDPRTDGKRYERSHNFSDGGAVLINASNARVQDIRTGKTCLAHALTNDPIGSYCLAFTAVPGQSVVRHCFLYYGSKHLIGIAEAGLRDDVLVDDVQCEQGSPYPGPGGQSVFVSFTHWQEDLQIVHRFHRCRSLANSGLIGSAEGVMALHYPVYYCHNMGFPDEPQQFDRFEFIDCDFGKGNIQGGGVKETFLQGTRCGTLALLSDVVAERCTFQGMNQVYPGASLNERHCIHVISGTLGRNPVHGRVDIQSCSFDALQVTDILGGVPQSSLFTREGELGFVFRNNLVLMPESVPLASVFGNFESQDSLQFSHNAYQLGESKIHHMFKEDNVSQNLSFSQWQAKGQESGSFNIENPELDGLRPQPRSPLINAGLDLGPAIDHSGQFFKRRNDIGAFESPASSFSDWQIENFTEEELGDPEISSPCASYTGDGQTNLMRYAMGFAAEGTTASPVQVKLQRNISQGVDRIEVLYRRSKWLSDLTLQLMVSNDLTMWSRANVSSESVLSETSLAETVSSVIICPINGRVFVKLRVEQN